MLTAFFHKIRHAAINDECAHCRKPAGGETPLCATCCTKLGFREAFPLTGAGRFELYAATLFTPAVKNLLYHYKFYGRQSNRPVLDKILSQYWQSLIPTLDANTTPNDVIVTCIPPHFGKAPMVDAIARQFARANGYRFSNRVLAWQREVEPQHTLHSRRKRIDNMKNSLIANAGALYFNPRRIIVVDDLSTTGATLLEAYRALRDMETTSTLVTGLAISHIPLAFQRKVETAFTGSDKTPAASVGD